jgi:glycosyltransferase involved in cell wall biosynthesis
VQTRTPCGIAGVVRNVGIHATRSRYLAFLDDDNVWHPNHLATCIDTLEELHVDLVYASAHRLRPDGSRYDTIGRPWDRRVAREENFVDTSAIVARRLRGVRFCRTPLLNAQFAEDWELIYRFSRHHAVAWTQAATVDYSLSPNILAILEQARQHAG